MPSSHAAPSSPEQHNLLEGGLNAERIAPIALHAWIGNRGRLEGGAAESQIRDEYRGDGADCDEQGKSATTVHGAPQRPSATGTSAASASAAARRNGVENASVTARSS